MTSGDQLYLADSGNGMIRRLDLTADPVTITTVAGNTQAKKYGGDGGRAVDAQLNTPEGVAVDTAGNLFIADSDNNLVRKVDANGIITTIAGDAAAAQAASDAKQPVAPRNSAGDGGPATSAILDGPRGIAVDSKGNVFVAQEAADPATSATGARIRRIDPSGTINSIAGTGNTSARGRVAGDPGPVPAGQAEFNTMHDLAIDAAGNLWIADSKNNLVRVLFDPANAPALGAPAPPATQPPGSPPPAGPAPRRFRASRATGCSATTGRSSPSVTPSPTETRPPFCRPARRPCASSRLPPPAATGCSTTRAASTPTATPWPPAG